MRRDDIRALHEERASIHAEMLKVGDKAAKGELTAEDNQELERMTEEFRSVGKRAELAEQLYKQDQEVKRDLHMNIDTRVGLEDKVPESFGEYRSQRLGTPLKDEPEYRGAFWKYLGTSDDHELEVEEHRALSKGTAAAGGFLVPTDFYRNIIRSLRFMGAFAQLATEITTENGDTLQIPQNTAHGNAIWLAEGGGYTNPDETFAQASLGAFKAAAKVIVSEELMQDSAFPLDTFLAQEIGERLGVIENTAYVMGDGSGKPSGILSSATAANITLYTAAAAAGNTTSFTYDALVTGIFTLPYQYRRNASWVVADAAVRNLYLLKDGQQRPLWNVNMAESGPDTFLGYPIYTDPDMPTPAIGNISMAFGDWKRAYMIRRVTGFGIQRQNELHSDTGQIGFRAFERVDGKVVLPAAALAFKHPAT